MDKKTQTVATYDRSAEAFAKKFDDFGPRFADIKAAFQLIDINNPVVLEIGCGNGRDAQEINKYTDNYLGIDISEKLIELARKKVPTAKFLVADVENFDFPDNLDLVFAFASLIHVPKEILHKILSGLNSSLKPGGIIRLSLKYAEKYAEVLQNDELGIRTFYLYSGEDVAELAKNFDIVSSKISFIRNKDWLEVILQKPVD